MKLNEQLKYERIHLGLSIQGLQKLIEQKTNHHYTKSTINSWEIKNHEISSKALIDVSNFYGISIDDLYNPDVDPKIDLNEEFEKFGYQISQLCGIHDITGFLQRYTIFNKINWIATPKYDFIFRIYYDYLLNVDHGNPFTLDSIYQSSRIWMKQTEYNSKGESEKDRIIKNLYTDSSGHLSIKDKRDPIKITHILENKEYILEDLAMFIENSNLKGMEISKWDYLEN